jgi:hypothetical protein
MCMRTTLDLRDDFLLRAKKLAAERNMTLTAIVEDALGALLAPKATGRSEYKLAWRPHRGEAAAGLDVADRDRLYELMEGRN